MVFSFQVYNTGNSPGPEITNMVLRRKTCFLAAFLVLILLGFLFYSYTDQPYYHSGFSMTARPDGFHVRRG